MAGWTIDQFNKNMIRLKNDGNMLVLQAKSGDLDVQEFNEDGEQSLVWDGDVVRLIVTKFEEDGNIKMEFTQQTNGFPIAMFNGLPQSLFDDFKRRADKQKGEMNEIEQRVASMPTAAPAAGRRRRKTRRTRRS